MQKLKLKKGGALVIFRLGSATQEMWSGKIGVKLRFKEGTVAKGKCVLGKNLNHSRA